MWKLKYLILAVNVYKKMNKSIVWKKLPAILLFTAILAGFAESQIATGGNYTIEKSVTANGGASGSSASVGGNYKIEGTIGQNAAGTTQQNLPFKFHPGFWNAAPNLIPTAASVTVGGRVLTADGRGIRNVFVTLTDANGAARTVISGTFGSYHFDDIPAGEIYVFTAHSKRFTFSESTQVLSILEDTDTINFTANNEN